MATGNMTTLQKFAAYSGKIASNPYVRAVQSGFVSIIPALILSSVATLLNAFIFNDGGILSGAIAADTLATIRQVFTATINATSNMLAIIVAAGIAYNLAKLKGYKNELGCVIMAVIIMFMLMPTTINVTVDETTVAGTNIFSTSYTGSGGMLVAILVGLVGTSLFMWLSSNKKLQIKMPAGVPDATVKAFNEVIPTVIVGVVFGLVALACNVLDMSIYDLVRSLIQAPLKGIATSPLGYAFVMGLGNLAFSVGIHSSVITQVVMPFEVANYAENVAALNAGLDIPNIISSGFWTYTYRLGGSGCILALVIAVFLVGRRKQSREVAKTGLIPALFNIGEPMIFGMPIVFNPILIIPFVLASVATVLVAYGVTAMGLVPVLAAYSPSQTPVLISGFLASGGNLATPIFQAVLLAMNVCIYAPFVKLYEASLPPEEPQEEAVTETA